MYFTVNKSRIANWNFIRFYFVVIIFSTHSYSISNEIDLMKTFMQRYPSKCKKNQNMEKDPDHTLF